MVQPQQEGYLLGNKTGANLQRERGTEGGGSPMDSSIYPCQAAQNKACRPLAMALHYTMSPQYEYDLHLIIVNHAQATVGVCKHLSSHIVTKGVPQCEYSHRIHNLWPQRSQHAVCVTLHLPHTCTPNSALSPTPVNSRLNICAYDSPAVTCCQRA